MKLLRFPRLFGFSRPRHNFSDSNILLSEKFTCLLDDNHHTSTCEISTVGSVSDKRPGPFWNEIKPTATAVWPLKTITCQFQPLLVNNRCWSHKKKNWLSTISTVHQPTGFIHRTGCTGPTQLVVSSNSSKTKPAERKKICSVGVPSPHSRWEGCEGKADLQIKLILIHEICGKHLRN